MKVMAILFRVVFSILVLLALACYLQVSPTISLRDFYATLDPNVLVRTLQGVNAVTISLVVILLLGILSFTRILEAAWNVLFCISILVLLACGTYGFFGPGVALPHAICNSETIRQFCETALTYQVPIALTVVIFAAGWICASACGRVAITSVISYGLWYGISEFFSYIVHLWSGDADPSAPEALNMVLGTPWVIAAVPGAFFLIYALLMSFFETFITNKPATTKAEKKEEKKEEAKPAGTDPGTDAKAAVEPKQKTKPLATTAEPRQKTLRLATGDAAPKKLKTTAPAEAPKSEEKPAEAPKAEEPKPEETPAEALKAKETQPEETPAEAPKAEETQPEETPAEAPKAEEPKPEETPAEAPKAKETQPEETPAEAPKAEETKP